MSSLFEDEDGEDAPAPGARSNQTEMTVSELSSAVKRTVEDRFGMVRVRGEIGRISRPRSGHVYLSLKDDRAVIDGVIWKGLAARLRFQPEEGMEVVATGKVTTYPGQSKYQIVIESMEPAGAGALMAMLEARRKALTAEGLFAAERKRAIPYLPRVIGVVTSPSGAVIRDILHRVSERFPRHVLVWPVAVQGAKCALEVAAAIRGFNALEPGGAIPRPDVLIVARGGGSLEDLWGFNEEIVVRAAAESRIPLISAVGHETDVTLIDHAADLRAPTPTGAAEKAVPVRADLLAMAAALEARRLGAMTRRLDRARERLSHAARLLPKPEALAAERRQRLDLATERLPRALLGGMERRRARLAQTRASLRPAALHGRLREERRALQAAGARLAPALARGLVARGERLRGLSARMAPQRLGRAVDERRTSVNAASQGFLRAAKMGQAGRMDRLERLRRTLEALSYVRVLDRGYAVVRSTEGAVLTRAGMVEPGAGLDIEFAGGAHVGAVATGGGAPTPKPQKKKAAPMEPPSQGDLFS